MRKILLCTVKWLLISLSILGFGASVKAEDYGLKIAGVPVTSDNYTNLAALAPGKITLEKGGYFAYDPENKILTMRKVTIKADTDENAIFNRNVDGLRIVVAGKNTLDATTWAALNIWRPTVLHGTGKLVVKSTKNYGIYLDKASLTISDIVVEVSGRYGISGESTGEKVEVNNATVTLNGTSGATVKLDGFNLVGCQIVEPAGAAWSASDHAIMAGGVNPKKVKIEPTPSTRYDLLIAGVKVTNKNCNDLSGISDKVSVPSGGQFKYDPQNKILTLKGVTIESDTEIPIHNEGIEGLKIRFLNANTIKSANKEGILILKDTEFQGDGKLIVETPSEAGIRVNKNAQLTISTIIIEVSGQLGISGTNATSDESLKLNKTAITAKGTGFAIGNFSTCILRDCRIASPAKGKWDDTQRTIVDATNTVAQEVKIVRSAPSPSPTPDPNAVEDAVFAGILVAPNPFSTVLRISNVERTGIRYSLFDAQGVSILSGELPEGEISLSTEALPAGLYLLQLQAADGAIKHWRVVK